MTDATPDASPHPGPDTIVVLTQEPLLEADARRIVGLHEGEDIAYRVLVPADTRRSLLVTLLDGLALLRMKEVLQALKPVNRTEARAEAGEALERSIASLASVGRTATGEVVADDPLPQLRTEVGRLHAREVVVVTEPHAVEDTFHADWASRARDELGLPVLHLYAGDWRVG
ncbi:hypothetical protein [Lapillicoccus jejuensis]|uniref:hypothetical protein n=1 Tax=Lapillicoccus jejuensis TaxID=402171 RepID=UPI00115261A7|nr:hypothetical protein [Lapillicoccus jejuensis]